MIDIIDFLLITFDLVCTVWFVIPFCEFLLSKHYSTKNAVYWFA